MLLGCFVVAMGYNRFEYYVLFDSFISVVIFAATENVIQSKDKIRHQRYMY